MKIYKSYKPFALECGQTLAELQIAYHIYGNLNEERNNVIWIAHALTANSDAADWWSGLVGEGKLLDPKKYFIVCANMLGSSYGATNANSIDPKTKERYGKNWPIITVRDMVASHDILCKYLNINSIYLGIGGSMGGQQILEWSISNPDLFENTCLLASAARAYPWSIAINESQRMALHADQTLYLDTKNAGHAGMQAARSMALISYRNYVTYNKSQQDLTDEIGNYRVTSYQQYQGLKLSRRFLALSYLSILHSMDSHNVGRNRGGIQNALGLVRCKTLVIGIESDNLYPINEQVELANYIPNSTLKIIESPYGHDGFLIENEQIQTVISRFLSPKKVTNNNLFNNNFQKKLQRV